MKESLKFEYLVNTLNLILLPKMDVYENYLSLVNSNLEELEGDYYTFFHENNIDELVTQKIINPKVKECISNLRTKIKELDATIWDANSFIFSEEWSEIRNMTLKVIISINPKLPSI